MRRNGHLWSFFLDVSSKWTKMEVFIFVFFIHLNICIQLYIIKQTEVGSAGEQPARNNLTTDENVINKLSTVAAY